MLNHYKTVGLLRALIIGLMLTATPVLTWAQFGDADPYYVTVRIQTVKSDQVAAWESLRKERRDAEEAAGRPFSRVFQRIRGQTRTYLILTMDLDRGSYNAPAIDLSPTWGTRQQNTLESPALALTLEFYPELEANLDGWLTKDTDFLYVRLRTALPGRAQDYYDWQAEKLFPALKTLGATIRGGRLVLGGNIRTWVRMSVIDGWNELNQTEPETAESRSFQRMITEGEKMVGSSEDLLYRYRADLSFLNEQ